MIESSTIGATDTIVTRPIELQHEAMRNYTDLSIGPTTRELLNSDAQLQDAVNTFTSIAEIRPDRKKLAIFLPGLIVSSHTTFEPIISEFRSDGYDTIGVDYSDLAYSRRLTGAQLGDFLRSDLVRDKELALIGSSMGAGSIIDFLVHEEGKGSDNVKQVVLMGSIYSDDDIKNGMFGRAFQLINRLTPDMVAERFAPLVRRIISIDPEYDPKAYDEKMRVSNQALIDRIKSASEAVPLEKPDEFPGISAVIAWWEEDFASHDARSRTEALFPKRKVVVMPRHHGWVHAGSDVINAAIA